MDIQEHIIEVDGEQFGVKVLDNQDVEIEISGEFRYMGNLQNKDDVLRDCREKVRAAKTLEDQGIYATHSNAGFYSTEINLIGNLFKNGELNSNMNQSQITTTLREIDSYCLGRVISLLSRGNGEISQVFKCFVENRDIAA